MIDIIITGNDETINKNCQYCVPKNMGGKKLDAFDQIKAFLKSIKKNWKSDHNLFFMHSLPLGDYYRGILKDYNVEIIHTPNEKYVKGAGYNRITAYKYAPNQSTHSLITDYDVLCLKEPELDLDKDFQGGLSGQYLHFNFPKLAQKTKLKIDFKKYHFPSRPFQEYYKDKSYKMFPFINNGIVFIKNDFALSIADEIERLVSIFIKSRDSLVYHYDFQLSISLLIASINPNWSYFPKGCNFLSSMLNLKNWKDIVSLYHYVGSKKNNDYELVKEYFND